jgi:hypothetical protein
MRDILTDETAQGDGRPIADKIGPEKVWSTRGAALNEVRISPIRLRFRETRSYAITRKILSHRRKTPRFSLTSSNLS